MFKVFRLSESNWAGHDPTQFLAQLSQKVNLGRLWPNKISISTHFNMFNFNSTRLLDTLIQTCHYFLHRSCHCWHQWLHFSFLFLLYLISYFFLFPPLFPKIIWSSFLKIGWLPILDIFPTYQHYFSKGQNIAHFSIISRLLRNT